MVVRYLRANGFPDAQTTRQKLGHDGATAPGDIDFHPLVVLEAKSVATAAWPAWCRQTVAEALAGTVPMVVRRTRGVADVGLWECRVKATAWTQIVGRVPRGLSPDPYASLPDGSLWLRCEFGAVVSAVAAIDKDGTE